jgi:hypothetical protein
VKVEKDILDNESLIKIVSDPLDNKTLSEIALDPSNAILYEEHNGGHEDITVCFLFPLSPGKDSLTLLRFSQMEMSLLSPSILSVNILDPLQYILFTSDSDTNLKHLN